MRPHNRYFTIINIFKYKKVCTSCFTPHPSQNQHLCLEEVSEEDRTDRIKHVISLCTSGMIYMVFSCNGGPIHSVDIAMKAIYGTQIIEPPTLGTFSNVDSEYLVMNFLSNVELFHNKMIL